MAPPACLLVALMLFNGPGRIAGSMYFGRSMSGGYSSPQLLVSSIFLLT